MNQIRAKPTHYFGWRFNLYLAEQLLGTLYMSWCKQRGRFVLNETKYSLSRERLWSGDFLLAAGQRILARATKQRSVRRFIVGVTGRELTLEAASPFTGRFRLVEHGSVVGGVARDHLFARKCTLDFPEDMSVPVQIFLFWLVALMWRRAGGAPC